MKYFIPSVLFSTLLGSAHTFAASASADNMLITGIETNISSNRGNEGSAYIYVDTNYPLPGVCLYLGPTIPALEIDMEHASGKNIMFRY